ncbi:unnamed protein product [Chironomus riparius]|uniref:Insulin-like domain-containing protein n=1 Tax=Chironomus riparius TaxID=315576 RepID=A0A9N9S6G5_9DIPT|nr:unnamed protein product [Chironomus riparius]
MKWCLLFVLIAFCAVFAVAKEIDDQKDVPQHYCGVRLNRIMKMSCSPDEMIRIINESPLPEITNVYSISRGATLLDRCCRNMCTLRDLVEYCPKL